MGDDIQGKGFALTDEMRALAAAFAEGRAELGPDGVPRIVRGEGTPPSPPPTGTLVVAPRGSTAISAPGGVSMSLPAFIADAGERAARFTLEFFAARVANPNTRKA